eukprot:TRINITY_DN12864_c0_g1_i1.p1 TRINITY_DN12864_c0_g1~~TRINITY_DN12864_c0_g1_i1.p1  ORF type:complete len:200 (-),score=-14.07 TRINITY_DN12864_c0_g1_i1:535-1134(-)
MKSYFYVIFFYFQTMFDRVLIAQYVVIRYVLQIYFQGFSCLFWGGQSNIHLQAVEYFARIRFRFYPVFKSVCVCCCQVCTLAKSANNGILQYYFPRYLECILWVFSQVCFQDKILSATCPLQQETLKLKLAQNKRPNSKFLTLFVQLHQGNSGQNQGMYIHIYLHVKNHIVEVNFLYSKRMMKSQFYANFFIFIFLNNI